jgi:hypothetical protein
MQMRTTLDIDEDVLSAAKERARRENKTAGEVISELARSALTAPPLPKSSSKASESRAYYGLKPFPRRGGVVTNELIDRLREDDAY